MCPKFFQKSRLKAIKITATVERIITISTKCICSLVGKRFQDRGYENKGEIIYWHNRDNKSTNWRGPLCTGMDSHASWRKIEIHSEKHSYARLCFGDACILCFGNSVRVCSSSLWFQLLYFEVYFILLGYGNDSHDDDKDYEVGSKCRPKKIEKQNNFVWLSMVIFLCVYLSRLYLYRRISVLCVCEAANEKERESIYLATSCLNSGHRKLLPVPLLLVLHLFLSPYCHPRPSGSFSN